MPDFSQFISRSRNALVIINLCVELSFVDIVFVHILALFNLIVQKNRYWKREYNRHNHCQNFKCSRSVIRWRNYVICPEGRHTTADIEENQNHNYCRFGNWLNHKLGLDFQRTWQQYKYSQNNKIWNKFKDGRTLNG